MQDNAGKICIINNNAVTWDRLGEMNINETGAVYEVIRVIDSVPLFIGEHFKRMKNSLNALGLGINITCQEMKVQIQRLAEENKLKNFNSRVVVYHENNTQNLLIYVGKSYYPVKEEINNGVNTDLVHWERKNPNVKLVDKEYKAAVSRKMEESGAFEVLLVNSGGFITEGSKSNVFFVKGNRVFTAPGDCVLKGVTRQYILDVCRRLGLDVIETLINLNSLGEIEGVFISGTSIKVLPVSSIGKFRYESASHPTVTAIRDSFDRLIHEYINAGI